MSRRKSPSEAIFGLVNYEIKLKQLAKKIAENREIFDNIALNFKLKRELKKKEEEKKK